MTKICSKCGETKPAEAFNKQSRSLSGLRAECRECQKAKHRTYYDANADKLNAKTAAYRKRNPEKATIQSAKWAAANPERTKAKYLKYRHANLELCRQRDRGYRLRNLDKDAAKSAKRHASQRNATPKWLSENDRIDILSFYTLSAKRTAETGIRHQVDHIVPLQGKTVCGLHVPWNMQVLPAKDNLAKRAKLNHPVIDMPIQLPIKATA